MERVKTLHNAYDFIVTFLEGMVESTLDVQKENQGLLRCAKKTSATAVVFFSLQKGCQGYLAQLPARARTHARTKKWSDWLKTRLEWPGFVFIRVYLLILVRSKEKHVFFSQLKIR